MHETKRVEDFGHAVEIGFVRPDDLADHHHTKQRSIRVVALAVFIHARCSPSPRGETDRCGAPTNPNRVVATRAHLIGRKAKNLYPALLSEQTLPGNDFFPEVHTGGGQDRRHARQADTWYAIKYDSLYVRVQARYNGQLEAFF